MRLGVAVFLCWNGCTFSGAPPSSDGVNSDASPEGDAAVVFGEWSDPVRITGYEVAGPAQYDDPILTQSGSLYWCVEQGADDDIFVGQLDLDTFVVTGAAPVADLDTDAPDTVPWMNDDETLLLFSRRDPSESNQLVIHSTSRAQPGDPWSGPTKEDFVVANAIGPNVVPGSLDSTRRELIVSAGDARSFDLYRVRRQDDSGPFGDPEPLPNHNNLLRSELGGRLWNNDLVMTHASRENPDAQLDLFISTRERVGDEFPLGDPIEELNDPLADDNDLWLNEDMTIAVFSSTRDSNTGGLQHHLYISTRTRN